VRKDHPLRAIRATVDEGLTQLQSTGGRRARTSCRTAGEAVAGAAAADAVSTAELISTNLLHENEGYLRSPNGTITEVEHESWLRIHTNALLISGGKETNFVVYYHYYCYSHCHSSQIRFGRSGNRLARCVESTREASGDQRVPGDGECGIALIPPSSIFFRYFLGALWKSIPHWCG
jgi:hypothetical protein